MATERSIILGIESSCDDTGLAVCIDGKIHSNVISSQLKHAEHGGVVPELASRMHLQAISYLAEQALQQACVTKHELTAVAYTAGPGLLGSLLVGLSFAKGLALALNKPMVAVNHMHGHIASLLLAEPPPAFPMLVLTASGGHTQLQVVHDPLTWEVIGRTRDDAAGEAFDKAGKMLGLPYPGGPAIDKLAKEGKPSYHAFPQTRFENSLDFSFSGLKTSVLYYLQKLSDAEREAHLADIAASVQHAIVSVLLDRLFEAAEKHGIGNLGIAGGVSANSGLRAGFAERCTAAGYTGTIPAFEYCTDNAAMIAIAGHHLYQAGQLAPLTAGPFAR